MQINTKCRNRKYHWTKYTYKQLGYQHHATLDTWSKCSHTIYTVLQSEACVPDHEQKSDPQFQNVYKHCTN